MTFQYTLYTDSPIIITFTPISFPIYMSEGSMPFSVLWYTTISLHQLNICNTRFIILHPYIYITKTTPSIPDVFPSFIFFEAPFYIPCPLPANHSSHSLFHFPSFYISNLSQSPHSKFVLNMFSYFQPHTPKLALPSLLLLTYNTPDSQTSSTVFQNLFLVSLKILLNFVSHSSLLLFSFFLTASSPFYNLPGLSLFLFFPITRNTSSFELLF